MSSASIDDKVTLLTDFNFHENNASQKPVLFLNIQMQKSGYACIHYQ
jgi:hypothetical protein